jgi:putative flippase GtrA
MKIATKKISFRVDESLHEFLNRFARENNIHVSTLIRNVLIYFHLAYITGQLNKDIYQLRRDLDKGIKIDKDIKDILGIKG